MTHTHCLIPTSLGELYDKYSILQIKSEKIVDSDKLLAIKAEMKYLEPLIIKYGLDEKHKELIKSVNEKLWDIEERIREKEVNNEFDDEFIYLARQVYKTNDERYKVKNIINMVLKSDISEVKSYVDV